MGRSIGGIELLVIFLVATMGIFVVVPFCRISQRLGYSPAWGLLTLLPFGVLAWSCFVAFSRWPNDPSPQAPLARMGP